MKICPQQLARGAGIAVGITLSLCRVAFILKRNVYAALGEKSSTIADECNLRALGAGRQQWQAEDDGVNETGLRERENFLSELFL